MPRVVHSESRGPSMPTARLRSSRPSSTGRKRSSAWTCRSGCKAERPQLPAASLRLRKIRVLVRIGWRAAAEKAQRFHRPDRVPCAGWNKDSVANRDLAGFAVDLHLRAPFQDEVELLRKPVVMTLSRTACLNLRLGEALLFDW